MVFSQGKMGAICLSETKTKGGREEQGPEKK